MSCPIGRFQSQKTVAGEKLHGTPDDFAPKMQQKKAPENCHRLQCKMLLNVAVLVNAI